MLSFERFLTMLGIRTSSDALVAQAAGWDRVLTPALLMAAAFLGLGLVLPIVVTTKLFIFRDEVSLIGAVCELWRVKQYFLSVVMALCSIVFPTVKLATAGHLWRTISVNSPHFRSYLGFIDVLGRWSLADVLIVAILIVLLKASAVVSASMGVGMYPFTASVVLTAVVVSRIKHVAQKSGPGLQCA
jgi:paraquat-inducible protein A